MTTTTCTHRNCPTHGKCYCRPGRGVCGYHCIKADAVVKEDGSRGCFLIEGDVKFKDEVHETQERSPK